MNHLMNLLGCMKAGPVASGLAGMRGCFADAGALDYTTSRC